MNIKAITSGNTVENCQAFRAKLPLSRIKFAKDINNKELPVDNYVREMLIEQGNEIEKVADFLGKDVVLAQRGKLLLANSGPRTSVIDMRNMKNGQELIDGITNNLKINA